MQQEAPCGPRGQRHKGEQDEDADPADARTGGGRRAIALDIFGKGDPAGGGGFGRAAVAPDVFGIGCGEALQPCGSVEAQRADVGLGDAATEDAALASR